MTIVEQKDLRVEFPLSEYPAIGRFALDLVEGSAKAARFCARPRWSEISSRKPQRDRTELASALVRSNRTWNNDVEALLAKWTRGEGVAIVAGQQVGFGGGPFYTLVKIASLLSIRRRLEARGVPAVPFFWLASEDHDFDEVATLQFQRDGELIRLRSDQAPGGRCPVGPLPLPESLRAGLSSLLGYTPTWLRPGVTFTQSFAELVVEAAGSGELVLVDSLLPRLRQEGAGLFESIAENLDELERLLDRRSGELAAAGYRPQVERGKEGHYSLLYSIDEEGDRHPVLPRPDGFVVEGKEAGREELFGRIRNAPERISTGVLARPLLQDLLLEPAVFVGGPAEVAYYAQLGPLHARLGVNSPPVALRGHVLAAPARRLRALEKWGIEPTEIFQPLEEVVARRETDAIEKIGSMMREAEDALDGASTAIAAIALEADRGLEKAMSRSRTRIGYQLEKMNARARRAVARRDRERWEALSRLQSILYPGGAAQDRVAGWIGWWSGFGSSLVERLIDDADPDSPVVRITGIS